MKIKINSMFNLLKWLLLLRCVYLDAVDLAPKTFHSPILGCDLMNVDLLNRPYPHCMVWHCPPKVPLDFDSNENGEWGNEKNATININFNLSCQSPSFHSHAASIVRDLCIFDIPCTKFLTLTCCLQ